MRTPLAVLTAASVVSATHAATVWLGTDGSSISEISGEGAQAQYRISKGDWDAGLSTSSSITSSNIVQESNLGNTIRLNAARFAFEFNYSVADGYTFNLTHLDGGDPGLDAANLSWSAPHNSVDQDRSFNAINISAQATDRPGWSSTEMAATDLNFTVNNGANINGSLNNLVSNSTGSQLEDQWIIADFDLSQTDWSLTGIVEANYTPVNGQGLSSLDDAVKFTLKTNQVTSSIPTPGAAALAGIAALGTIRRTRR